MSAIIENVVYQHAENACWLWVQRQNAVDAPHYSFFDLVHLDSRVEANIDGLRIAGVHGLPFIEEMITANDEGGHFAKALIALEQSDSDTFFSLIDKADNDSQISREVESALAWANPEYLRNIVQKLLSSDQSAANVLGLRACASHGKDPGKYLETHLRGEDMRVRCAALQVGAELGNSGIVGLIVNRYECETEEEKFELGRALALLGERQSAKETLNLIALSESHLNTKAVNLLLQMSDSKAGRTLLKKLDAMKGRERDVVRGFGLLGDPVAMGWLIQRTEIPELSRLAGEAISMITGVDLTEGDLEAANTPEGFEDGGISDNPDDDNIALDEDEDLPWPNPESVSKWWEASEKIVSGNLFLNGLEKTESELRKALNTGMQRQRNAAAISLSLLKPESRYLDTRLPTVRQRLWMS